jgi:hypothetical protein
MTSSGVVMTILGIFAAMLGVAAFANQSVLCLVNPGGFPCIMRYQVALLAPLYPSSSWLMLFGSLLATVGAIFTSLGQSKWKRTKNDISKIRQEPQQIR